MNDPFELHHLQRRKAKSFLKVLFLSAMISLVIFIIEAIGAYQSGSLALFADAGHIAMDFMAHGISILAIYLTQKKSNDQYHFGFFRSEVLAAFANALLLVGMSLWILVESYSRIMEPEHIHSSSMLLYSTIGLLFNGLAILVLFRFSKENINIRSTYLHVLGDALSTVGVIFGAILIHFTQWTYIDPIISIFISLLILRSSHSILRESVRILLERSPIEIPTTTILQEIQALDSTLKVYNFRIWSLSSGIHSAQVGIVTQNTERSKWIRNIHHILKAHHGIDYVNVECITEADWNEISKIEVNSSSQTQDQHHHGHNHSHHGGHSHHHH